MDELLKEQIRHEAFEEAAKIADDRRKRCNHKGPCVACSEDAILAMKIRAMKYDCIECMAHKKQTTATKFERGLPVCDEHG